MARPPRVLHVIVDSFVEPVQVRPLARALVAEGWEVDVASPPGAEFAGVEIPGVRYIPFPVSRSLTTPRHLGALLWLVRRMAGGKYALVHLHGPIPAMLGRVAAALTRTPAIYHCRGSYYESGYVLFSERLASRVYPPLERLLGRWTAWTFTLNRDDAADLVERARFPEERVTCLGVGGCGLDVDAWDPGRYPPAKRAEIRRRLGIPENKPVIGFVGRFVRNKGVLELGEAFRQVRAAGIDAHLLMVGGTPASERDQETDPELRRRIAEWGLEEHVSFPGLLRPPSDAMAVMDVLALPSYSESFGQVLVEAGALGIPVVAAASRGAREAVLDGETGLLVPLRDAPSLADALLRILRDPALARRLGERAHRRAREELRSERVLASILEVYRRVLPPGTWPAAPAEAGRGAA